MRFAGFDHPMTGVSLPVACLRSRHSLGSGEFLDLLELGAWCVEAGIEFIQLLPVNDTGLLASPYSAVSAFALHPLYLRIEALPELAEHPDDDDVKKVVRSLRKQRTAFEAHARMHYVDIMLVKLGLLRRIYARFQAETVADRRFKAWIGANPWVMPYAVYSRLKESNGSAAWKNWPDMRRPSREEVSRYWEQRQNRPELLFYAWVQWRLEEQLQAAARGLEQMGVFLKGDLPILMNEDSADVWYNPQYFDTGVRAGAPPDMFSDTGQNWDFPVYDWQALARDDYVWWKDRLRQADKFYHAYRIDHVLGFFRIWRIPAAEQSGVLGHFFPARFIRRSELHAAGFDDARIAWLSRPHVPGVELRAVFARRTDEVIQSLFKRIGNEDLYLFRDDVSESVINRLEYPPENRQALLELYRNRTLVEAAADEFVPAWYWQNSRAWASLGGPERATFQNGLLRRYWGESEAVWEAGGEKLLSFMSAATSMLACAEDLGAVPDCVPRVLARLGILGLKVPRWARRWKEPGEPFISPRDYPAGSVCAASVHDTSTLRQWWEREADRAAFWEALGCEGTAPGDYSPQTARRIMQALLAAASNLVTFQLQDFFALDETLRVANPEEERINTPGTVDQLNWTYRLPVRLEDLTKNRRLLDVLGALVAGRRSRRTG
jgi:4-alpha-glucanotransferase